MSTLRVGTFANAGGTQSTSAENVINGCAKAWVNFNGSGTVAIRRSYNVSSITDNGTGDYAVNFSSAINDANYAVAGHGAVSGGDTAAGWTFGCPSRTASSCRIDIENATDSGQRDPDFVDVVVFR